MSDLYFLVRQESDAVILDGACSVSVDTKMVWFAADPDVWVNACLEDWQHINNDWFDGCLFDSCFLVPCKSNESLSVDFGSLVASWKSENQK